MVRPFECRPLLCRLRPLPLLDGVGVGWVGVAVASASSSASSNPEVAATACHGADVVFPYLLLAGFFVRAAAELGFDGRQNAGFDACTTLRYLYRPTDQIHGPIHRPPKTLSWVGPDYKLR
jgi:hypothetical protein